MLHLIVSTLQGVRQSLQKLLQWTRTRVCSLQCSSEASVPKLSDLINDLHADPESCPPASNPQRLQGSEATEEKVSSGHIMDPFTQKRKEGEKQTPAHFLLSPFKCVQTQFGFHRRAELGPSGLPIVPDLESKVTMKLLLQRPLWIQTSCHL